MKDTDDLFIQCKKKECFPEHKFIKTAERVQMCEKLLEYVGVMNWD